VLPKSLESEIREGCRLQEGFRPDSRKLVGGVHEELDAFQLLFRTRGPTREELGGQGCPHGRVRGEHTPDELERGHGVDEEPRLIRPLLMLQWWGSESGKDRSQCGRVRLGRGALGEAPGEVEEDSGGVRPLQDRVESKVVVHDQRRERGNTLAVFEELN
jgi:hypothetical protein